MVLVDQKKEAFLDLVMDGLEETQEAEDLMGEIIEIDAKIKEIDSLVPSYHRPIGNYTI